MEDILENKLICRICLKVVDQTKQSYGNIEDDTGTLRDMMLCCIPEMDIYVSSNPILCFPCIQALVGLYNFKTKCINTETIIKTYMNRHNISEFGNVNLTCVVKDLIQINSVQKQIQDQKAAMVKQNYVITESAPKRTTEVVNDPRDNTPTEHSLQQEEAIPTQEISTYNVSQVSQKVSEENDSCPAKDAEVNISSDVPEVSADKTSYEKTPLGSQNQQSSLSLETDSKLLLNVKPCISLSDSHEGVTFPKISQSSANENTKATISCTGEMSVPNLEVLESSELSSEISKDKSENNLSIPVSAEETPKIVSQSTKPNNELHRPFFDNSIPVNSTTSSSDTSTSNSEVLQSFSQAPSYSISQQNLSDHLPSKSNSPILRRSSSSLTQSDISVPDQKEFDILSPQFEHSNPQMTSSPPELKNLDSEISQIIDQLGNDLDKEGNNFFSHVGNQPPQESQSNQPSQIFQENLHSSVNHHNETNQFPETSRHHNYSAHVSNRPLSQIGYHSTQMMQSSSRAHYSSADLRQFASQTNLNSSNLTQNSSQMGHCSSHMGSSDRMGMTSHLAMNRSELGQFPQQIPHMPHLSQMGAHSSQMGPFSSQMGQHLSQMGQTTYQIRPHLSQMGHSSQIPNSEMGYHQQMVRHPSHISSQYSQLSSQFPNISNHLRNGPQMGYVSSNMANALAQVGQVPSEYNQMSQQMKYLRMQLQIRHGFSPMGPMPAQFGNRPTHMDGRPSQVRQWLPSSEHDSSQGKFNSGHGQVTHDPSPYRPPQLPYSHVGYGHSQMNQGMGPLPQHMNPQHSQINHGSSQYPHSPSTQQPPHFSQMHYYLNRGPQHFNRGSPSQSPSLSEMPQRSVQQTPTPPSRSPLNLLHSQNRPGVFSPSNYDTFSSSESILSNNEIKKSDSPLNTCKSPDVGRYGEKDNWKINHFNFRASNSPLSRFVSPPINSQMRMPSQNIPIVPPHFGGVGYHHMGMPPPQTNFLPKDHLAQRLRLNSGISRVENLQSDNYHSTSDESINSLLVDLPPIEAPVVPLSVQIKSLGTLESIQQPIKESQEPSDVLSSVSDNVLCETKEIAETEVQNGSESAGMKESYISDERKTSDKPTETSESEVVTISKEDIYRENDEDSSKNNVGQDECSPEETLQKSSMEKMEIDPIVLNHFLDLPKESTSADAPDNIQVYQCLNCQFCTTSAATIVEHQSFCKSKDIGIIPKRSSGLFANSTQSVGEFPNSPEIFGILSPSTDTIAKEIRLIAPSNNYNSTVFQPKFLSPSDCFAMCSTSENGAKEFKCPHCPHVTNRAHALSKHINSMHTKAVWFHCDYCQYRSTDKSSLRRHVRNLHLNKGSQDGLSCDQCAFQCNSEHTMKRHRLKHESAILQCPFCSYCSKDRSNFRKHLFVHNQAEYRCKFCKYTCFSPYQLKLHLKNKHNSSGTDDVDCRSDIPLDMLVDEISKTVKESGQIILENVT